MHCDVLIIGGGPAGLATAMAAARRGLRVTVADVARPPIDKVCGEGLMPDGLAALSRLGFDLSGVPGHAFRGIRFSSHGASVEANFPEGAALGMRRAALHLRMVEQAAAQGIRMIWGARVEASASGLRFNGAPVASRWIVGADGGNSMVRRWAGLDRFTRDHVRFGFRRHYRLAPWTDCMELNWGAGCQIYVTPVAAGEVCVAVISPSRELRLEAALAGCPELARRLAGADPTDAEGGSVTAMRRLRCVWGGNVALVGDASGMVDAITGEGLCLAFQQSEVLADCLAAGDLARYQAEHRRIARRPSFMADLMLAAGTHPRLRDRALHALASRPQIFEKMLAMHVGALPGVEFARCALALAWGMLVAS